MISDCDIENIPVHVICKKSSTEKIESLYGRSNDGILIDGLVMAVLVNEPKELMAEATDGQKETKKKKMIQIFVWVRCAWYLHTYNSTTQIVVKIEHRTFRILN